MDDPSTYYTPLRMSRPFAPGADAGASWRAALNTPISVDVSGGNAQLRLRIAFLVEDAEGDSGYIFLVEKNAGGFNPVTASGSNVKTFNSSHFADGDDVPQRIASGSYQSDNNAAEESTGTFTLTSPLADGFRVETEIAIELIAADLANNDVLGFILVTDAPLAFDNYTQIPIITVIK